MNKKTVGFFSGSFDPIHKGHIEFALHVIKEQGLSEVYFLPEVKPRFKPGVSHISHRLAMLRIATKPYRQLKVLELPERQFSVRTTMPKLKQRFAGSNLVLLVGSDVAEHIADWDGAEKLLKDLHLVVAERSGSKVDKKRFDKANTTFLRPAQYKLSSSQIRDATKQGKVARGSLSSINSYIKKNWLYSEVPKSS